MESKTLLNRSPFFDWQSVLDVAGSSALGFEDLLSQLFVGFVQMQSCMQPGYRQRTVIRSWNWTTRNPGSSGMVGLLAQQVADGLR